MCYDTNSLKTEQNDTKNVKIVIDNKIVVILLHFIVFIGDANYYDNALMIFQTKNYFSK